MSNVMHVEGKGHLEHRRYPLGAGHSVYAVVVRELDGKDAIEAGRMARAHKALDEEEETSNIFREQIKLSIVAVQRTAKSKWQRVAQPFDEFEDWKLKSQNLIVDAYKRLNIVDEEERKNFQQGSEVVGATDAPGDELEDEVIELPRERPVDALRKIPV